MKDFDDFDEGADEDFVSDEEGGLGKN